MSSFLAELKRRNVIRMGGLYLVGAWLVTQVAATLQRRKSEPSRETAQMPTPPTEVTADAC